MIDAFGNRDDYGFFAVYDGHGGRGVVEFVAHHLHQV
jgi:serine/threonine protein phosphatase PrpC